MSYRVNMKLLFTKNKLGVENRTLCLRELHYWLVVEHKIEQKDHHIECSQWLPLKPFCIPNDNPKFTFEIVFTQFFSRICCWMYHIKMDIWARNAKTRQKGLQNNWLPKFTKNKAHSESQKVDPKGCNHPKLF